MQNITPESLVPHLKRCGYNDALRESNYSFGAGQVPVAAFSDTLHDVRSACIAVIDAPTDPKEVVASIRPLGAPVVFVCHQNTVQWWKQTTGEPKPIETGVGERQIAQFFDKHKGKFTPATISEGKTLLRLPGKTQLSFVDAGLMPFIERGEGERLSSLVGAAFRDIEGALNRKLDTDSDAQNAIKATFWLLAAKALHDKQVDRFKNLELTRIDDVFDRVGRHYGILGGVPPSGRAWHDATARAAERIAAFDNLRNLSAESLAHVYENAMVTPEIRKANGTHSTPGPLVDYIVWQLWPWIEKLPPERRHVFEPACGEATFMVSSLRVLRQWSDIQDGKERHDYLKKHLHGIEFDLFAIEVARLSLTLTDIPYENKWDLTHGDMFLANRLEEGARDCGVLLANPPYEKFTLGQKADYEKAGVGPIANTKACEMLRRTIPHLREGSCFGVVVPRGLLHSKEATSIRQIILSDFELAEIDIFEDKLFATSDHEAAVLMGRRKGHMPIKKRTWFRRVRNPDMGAFRDRFLFSSQDQVETTRFEASETADFRVPDCDAVWRFLNSYPTLSEIASVGQGFSFRGRDLPRNAKPLSSLRKSGYRPCFVTSRGNPPIFQTPERKWMDPSPPMIQAPRIGLDGQPGQVLVNHARVSRSKWSMKAWLDDEGIAVKGNFLVARSKQDLIPGLLIWALLNSPIANAYVYCLATKRHIIGSDLLRLPIPRGQGWADEVVSSAEAYLTVTRGKEGFFRAEPSPDVVKAKLLAMDAAVLEAYDLHPRIERQVLDLFEGVPRKGVGCKFTGYYPPGFTSFLPLHFVISDRFERARADLTADRFKPGESEHVRKALAAAVAHKAKR